jgi:hypothetical protein
MTKKESCSDDEHSNSDYSEDECEHKKVCKKCEKKRKEKSKKCGKCDKCRKNEKHKVETIKDVKCKTEGQNIVITIKQCCP